MIWEKKGIILEAKKLGYNLIMCPTPLEMEDRLRIYCAFCDENNIGRIGYVDCEKEDPSVILEIHDKPVLDIGLNGCFDDNGIVPCGIVKLENEIRLYYSGFQKGVKVPYYMFTGLSVSKDAGNTFHKISKTPILDRKDTECYARCGSYILRDGIYKMWYMGTCGDGWTYAEGKLKPVYCMHYIESEDGINWSAESRECLRLENEDEHGFGKPYIWKEKNIYRMLYGIRTYSKGYQLGYAESQNGYEWERMDERAGLGLSESGFDDKNICNPYIAEIGSRTYLFYNGNSVGRGTGFGYAVLKQSE